jgi:hypothetical protein
VRNRLPAAGTPRFGYVRKGRVPDPVKPNHYRKDIADPLGERYEPDPRTGPVLAEMYRRYVSGQGSYTIIRWLNGNGITGTKGNSWSDVTLFNVLDSGFGAGLLRQHDPACRCKRKINRCRRVIYVPGAHPAVISEKTWHAYQRRRRKARALPPRSTYAVYPLSGLMACGTCHVLMSVAAKRGQPGYAYRCTRQVQHRGCTGSWVRRGVAEQAVREKLGEWVSDREAAEAVTVSRRHAVTAARAGRQQLIRDLARIDKALGRLARQRAVEEDMPEAAYEAAKADLLASRAAAEAALEAAADAEDVNTGEYLPVIRCLREEWDLLPAARLRDMLALLIRRVEVHRTAPRKPARIEIIPVWSRDPGSA